MAITQKALDNLVETAKQMTMAEYLELWERSRAEQHRDPPGLVCYLMRCENAEKCNSPVCPLMTPHCEIDLCGGSYCPEWKRAFSCVRIGYRLSKEVVCLKM